MIILKRLFCTIKTPLARFLAPTALKVIHQQQIPKLFVKDNTYLLKNWWSQTPFKLNTELFVPVFSLETGKYTGEAIQLSHEIFNKPLRRDLIYRLYHWRENLNKFTTIRSKTQATIRGSGKKIAPQKGRGKARMGQLRVPGRNKGPKAHGRKPKVYSYHLNQKIKLLGLKSLLSSMLVNGKIRIIDSQKILQPKTKLIFQAFEKNVPQRATACIITAKDADQNFKKAQQNIQRIIWADSQNFDVKDLFRVDRVLITKTGLEELTENILKSTLAIHCEPYMKKNLELQQTTKTQEQTVVFDPQKPLVFKFKILEDYLKLYEKVKAKSPGLLEKQMKKIRTVQK